MNYFISRMEGYKSLKVIFKYEMEQYLSFKKEYNPKKIIFLQDNIIKYCPDIIYEIDKDDVLSVEDSEDEEVEFFEVLLII